MTKDEALKLALEALKWSKPREGAEIAYSEAIAALVEALAQPAQHYESGWNSALEMAAHQLENNFKRAFGDDTLKSIAVYIKGLKK